MVESTQNRTYMRPAPPPNGLVPYGRWLDYSSRYSVPRNYDYDLPQEKDDRGTVLVRRPKQYGRSRSPTIINSGLPEITWRRFHVGPQYRDKHGEIYIEALVRCRDSEFLFDKPSPSLYISVLLYG